MTGDSSDARSPGVVAPSVAARPGRAVVAGVGFALVLLTLASYWGVAKCDFVYFDDANYITENAHALSGLNARSVAWAFSSSEFSNWQPLTWLSHMADVEMYGTASGKHHLTSLYLHADNVLLLFLLPLGMTGALWRSALIGALFAVHPLNVESVAWVAERQDVLSAFFWFLGLWAWLGWIRTRTKRRYRSVLAFISLGLMAKPTVVTLRFALLLLDYWPLRKAGVSLREVRGSVGGLVMEKIPLFVLSSASCAVALIAQPGGGAMQSLREVSFGGRLANACLSYATCLGKTLWPTDLAVFYPHPHIAPTHWLVAVSALRDRGRTEEARAHFLEALRIRPDYADAQYDLGLSAARAGQLDEAISWYRRAVLVSPDFVEARNNLGVALAAAGKNEEAIATYREALRIRPDSAEILNNLGLSQARERRFPEALARFDRAVREDSDSTDAHSKPGARPGVYGPPGSGRRTGPPRADARPGIPAGPG